jgi:hypothetical protein
MNFCVNRKKRGSHLVLNSNAWARYLMATSTNFAGFWYYDQYVCSTLTIIRCIPEQEKWLLHCTSKILELIFCLQSNLNFSYETCGRSWKGYDQKKINLDPRRDEKHALIKQNCNHLDRSHMIDAISKVEWLPRFRGQCWFVDFREQVEKAVQPYGSRRKSLLR